MGGYREGKAREALEAIASGELNDPAGFARMILDEFRTNDETTGCPRPSVTSADERLGMKSDRMTAHIKRAEARYGSGAEAARVLGVSYVSWKKWKSGTRTMPAYIERSIDAHIERDSLSNDTRAAAQESED